MDNLRCILCPIDFSEATPFGLAVAESLALRFGASLRLLHVMPQLPMPVRVPLGADDIYEQWEAEAQERLQALIRDLRGRGAAARAAVTRGVAYGRVLAVAKEHEADLIVLPTHGRAGIDRLLHGSVAEAVVRAAKIPVLTVPPTLGGMGAFEPSRILVATDFSEHSRASFDTAIEWARGFAAELVIGHVFTWQQLGDDGTEWTLPTFTRDQVEEAIAETTRRLDRLASAASKAGIQASTDLSQGANPAAEIVRLAEEEGVGLVVVASHGHGLLRHALLGSTTAKLVRLCPCPLLTVPAIPGEHAAQRLEAVTPVQC